MTKREAKNRPILAVHILFAALMLSMYLPGNAKVKASPICMTAACVLIELAVIYQLIRRKKARTAGDIGAIVFFVLLFWQVYTTRLGRGHIILVPTPKAVFSVFYTMRERMILGIFSSLFARTHGAVSSIYLFARETTLKISAKAWFSCV